MTIDIDAIRQRYAKLESLADQEATGLRGPAYTTAVALAANASAADVPALCAKVDELTAALAEARDQAKDSAYAATQARLAVTQLSVQLAEVTADRDGWRKAASNCTDIFAGGAQ